MEELDLSKSDLKVLTVNSIFVLESRRFIFLFLFLAHHFLLYSSRNTIMDIELNLYTSSFWIPFLLRLQLGLFFLLILHHPFFIFLVNFTFCFCKVRNTSNYLLYFSHHRSSLIFIIKSVFLKWTHRKNKQNQLK